MRKEDRIRQQAQNPPKKAPEQPLPRTDEQMRGSGSEQHPEQPPRRPGVLPIPD